MIKPYSQNIIFFDTEFSSLDFYKFFGLDNFDERFNWIPVDFASVLFAMNINPEILVERKRSFFDKIRIDLARYQQHNALDDAKLV